MNLNIYHFTFFLLCYFSYPHQKLLLREMRVFQALCIFGKLHETFTVNVLNLKLDCGHLAL